MGLGRIGVGEDGQGCRQRFGANFYGCGDVGLMHHGEYIETRWPCSELICGLVGDHYVVCSEAHDGCWAFLKSSNRVEATFAHIQSFSAPEDHLNIGIAIWTYNQGIGV